MRDLGNVIAAAFHKPDELSKTVGKAPTEPSANANEGFETWEWEG